MSSNIPSYDNSNTHVLLIGADGMLGTAWSQLLSQHNIPHTCSTVQDFDITDPDTVCKKINSDITHVINCAAWTDVDGAETNEELATKVNGHAVQLIADQCHKVNAALIHYSTDYIFDGNGTAPYPVDAPTSPVNAYGRSKLVGEKAVLKSNCNHLIIRSSWLYAPWGKNFVITISKLAQDKDSLKVVNDQKGRPASCQLLAASTLKLLQKEVPCGIYHLNDGGECTWYEFASEIVKITGEDCKIEPCTTDEFPRPAKRPAYSVLDLSKSVQYIGELPHWKDQLKQVMQQIACSRTDRRI